MCAFMRLSLVGVCLSALDSDQAVVFQGFGQQPDQPMVSFVRNGLQVFWFGVLCLQVCRACTVESN